MSSRDDCTIGWICVENDQFSLGRRFFDEEYEVFETYNNRFIFGRIGNHSAVLAFQPEIFQPGIDNATRLGEDLVKIFTNVRVCFLVGIGGGVPNQEHDIRLGDVLVGFSDGNTSSVIQFDYERTILDNTFTIREFLPPPPTLIQEAIHELQTKYKSEDQRLQSLIGRNIQFQLSSERVITPPDPSADRLYISSFAHAGDPYERCETACGDDESRLVPRSPRSKNAGTPTIHYGLIASGDSPIRDAEIRDQLAAEKNILCFETGASRFMIDFPCLVIRGICNYCDTHNSQIWSHYAAITALAYAKDLLVILEPNKVEAESKLSKVLYDAAEDEHHFSPIKDRLPSSDPTSTFRVTFEKSNLEALRELIATQFDQAAIGEYSWLKGLKECGYSSNEMADLIFKQYNDSPWIFFEPTQYSRTQIRWNFHLPNCAHLFPRNSLGAEFPLWKQNSEPPKAEDVARLVHELCGIGGICPKSPDKHSWTGFVEFETDNVAFVSFGPNENAGPYHQPLLARICEALSKFCTAASKVQDLGLCCNRFTVAVRPDKELHPLNLVHLSHLSLQLASDMLSIIEEASSERTFDRLPEATSYAYEIINVIAPTITPNVEVDTETSLHLCALATQILCMGFVSYAQAHAGPFQPFFLEVDIKKIYLLGTRQSRSEAITVELVGLACIGEMIHDQAMTFGRPRSFRDLSKNMEQKFLVSTSLSDLLDTWGPGKFVVRRDRPNDISAIQIGSGMIWCSDTEERIFHWSQSPPSKLPESIRMFPDTQLVIGSLVTWNEGCGVELERCRTRSVHYLEQLGTHRPYWEDAEWQVGLQAGNYAIFKVNHTWSRIPGQTLKQCRLQQDDERLVFFLEEPWGLQISYCTGIARRVPLREVIADLLDIFLTVYLTTKADHEVWKALKNIGIIEALRSPNFIKFIRLLDFHFKPEAKTEETITRMVRMILYALKPTGIQQGELVVACFWEQNIFHCFKIPCQNDHAWASVLADSEDCATFAYMSSRCLETQKIMCSGTNNRWKNRVLLMQTSIVVFPAPEPEPTPHSLEDKRIYFFNKFKGKVYVQVRKSEQATPPELTMTSIADIPQKFILRLEAMNGRNRHHRRIREMQNIGDPAELVLVL